MVSEVMSSDRSEGTATITWTTDGVSTSQVEYGTATSYGSTSEVDMTSPGTCLSQNGLVLGKIYPRTVHFFEHTFEKETFRGGNHFAVRKEGEQLINSLSRYGP